MTSFAALMLAGGQSRRMGRPKAFLALEGEPLWRRQCALLETLAPSERLLSSPPGDPLAREGWRPIADAAAGAGPLGGIVAALETIVSPLLLVLGVDLPAMRADVLRRLLDAAQPGLGAAFRRETWYEPVAAVYPRELAPSARRRLERGECGLQALCAEAARRGMLTSLPLPEACAGAFRNWNTPADASGAETDPVCGGETDENADAPDH
ncbi:MAG: molybdenum cofactor guanylyltransferase [Verrucomicrobiae bacterium]|nr:molybdenum cofactor guanylyltransferase [Verrucomicrobiae bacterium]